MRIPARTSTEIIPVKLCAVMITRNEEKNIARCLESLHGVVDDIYIEDTGSTDNTIRIAEEHGAWVHSNPWRNDFAYHRNSVMRKADGTWLLWIDADEIVTCPNPDLLKKTLFESSGVGFCTVPLANIKNGIPGLYMMADRLIKKGSVVFQGACHEHVSLVGKDRKFGHTREIAITHFGYDLPPEEMAKKNARNREILLNMYNSRKGKWHNAPADASLYRHLIQNYISSDMYEDAFKIAYEYQANFKGNVDHDTIYTMYQLCMLTEERDNAFDWLQRGLKLYDDDIDIYYCLYHYGKTLGDPDAIIAGGRGWFKKHQQIAKRGGPGYETLGGHVLFTYTPDHFNEILANLVTAQITTGMSLLHLLNPNGSEHKKEIMEHLTGCFDKFKEGIAA